MKTFSRIIKSVFAIGLLATSSASFAIPVSGSIGMGGSFTPIDNSGNIVPLNVATGIDFDPNLFRVASSSTGDFAALSGQVGTIQDLQYIGFTGPIVNFWTVGGFAFELTTVNVVPTGNSSLFLNLSGTGTISGSGFDDTLGTWAFSGNGPSGTFSWSAGTSALGVPEPMALALIGIGLVGFVGVRGFCRG